VQVPVVRTFVFADLAGYTALTEAHGDAGATAIALRFAALAREVLEGRAGAELVKTIGDAVMIATETPIAGVDVALALRAAVEREPWFPAVRIGLQHGPAVECAGDYFGASVNVAARVAGVATAGHIVATGTVATAASSQRARFEPLGATRLKNVTEPVALFEVVDAAIGVAPAGHALWIDPVCRMAVDPSAAAHIYELEGTRFVFCSDECAAAFSSVRAAKAP
jgi:class 3 adenylate cyclase/YHS domain-containing protein